MKILDDAKKRCSYFNAAKHFYKVDYYRGKYCIVRLTGNKANILSRGNRAQAEFAIKRLNETEKLG